MSDYVVSARKYRPVKFNDVVGQQHVTKTIKNALKSNKVGHSFLFTGPRGVGKTTTARILAKVLNCTNRSEDFEPCNTCDSCEAFNANGSFNIQELDAASHNSVDDIRALVEQVRFAPQQGQYKIYIIDEVHMLSQSAFNAFLKTLEEPPPYAVFILATTEKHKIIPTILSRCQIFDFKRVGVEDMVKHLQYIVNEENLEAEEDGLHVIAQKADGALRDALSIFDRIVSFSEGKIDYDNVIKSLNLLDYDTFFQITDALLIHDKDTVLTLFDEVLQKGFEADIFMLGLASHFRDLLVGKNEATVALLEVPASLKERYKNQAQLANDNFILNGLNIANTCDVGYKAARNKRLHVELALLKVCYLGMQQKAVELPAAVADQSKPIKVAVVPQKVETKTKAVASVVPQSVTPVVEESIPAAEPTKEKAIPVVEAIPEKENEVAPPVAKETIEEKAVQETVEETPIEKTEVEPVAEESKPIEKTIPEPEPKPQAVAEPTPKITKPGSGLKLKNLTAQIGKSKPTVEKKAEKDEDVDISLLDEIDETKLAAAWQDIIENFDQGKSPALKQALFTSKVSVKDKVVILEVQGSLAKQMIHNEQVALNDRLKELCDIKRIKVDYIVNEVEDNLKRSRTQQEQLDMFIKKNPAIKDLTDRFDLEIDYS